MENAVFSRSFIRECRIPHARLATMIVTGVQLPATMTQTSDGEIVNEIDFVSSHLALV